MRLFQRGVLPPVQLEELATEVYETGTYDPTWTGFSAAPAVTFDWTIYLSGIVTLVPRSATVTGTSNAITMTWTDFPAAIRPAFFTRIMVEMLNNDVDMWGTMLIRSDATV